MSSPKPIKEEIEELFNHEIEGEKETWTSLEVNHNPLMFFVYIPKKMFYVSKKNCTRVWNKIKSIFK